MFSYNIAKKASQKTFERTCSEIESHVIRIGFVKEKLLEDVDGSQIQIYSTPTAHIKVFNDYEVDAVYIDSDVALDGVI